MGLLRKPTKRMVLAGLVILSAALAVLPSKYSRVPCRALGPFLVLLGEPGVHVGGLLRDRAEELVGGSDPGRDAELTAFLTAVKAQIEDQQRRIERLQNWRSRLDARDFPCRLIPAGVVGAEALPLHDRRLLDAGATSGVASGDLVTTRRLLHRMSVALPEHLTVLGRNYVVGRIIEPAAYTATLQLVTDPEFKVAGNLWRIVAPGERRSLYVDSPEGGRVRAEFAHDGRPGPYPVGPPIPVFAHGDGRGIVLEQVIAQHGVRPGDILTTRQSPKLLLAHGAPIGRVTHTRRDPKHAHCLTVFVEPLANLENLREVYVVMPITRVGRPRD